MKRRNTSIVSPNREEMRYNSIGNMIGASTREERRNHAKMCAYLFFVLIASAVIMCLLFQHDNEKILMKQHDYENRMNNFVWKVTARNNNASILLHGKAEGENKIQIRHTFFDNITDSKKLSIREKIIAPRKNASFVHAKCTTDQQACGTTTFWSKRGARAWYYYNTKKWCKIWDVFYEMKDTILDILTNNHKDEGEAVLLLIGSSYIQHMAFTLCRCSQHSPCGEVKDVKKGDPAIMMCQLSSNTKMIFYDLRETMWGTRNIHLKKILETVRKFLREVYPCRKEDKNHSNDNSSNDTVMLFPKWAQWANSEFFSADGENLPPWPDDNKGRPGKLIVLSDMGGPHNLWRGRPPRETPGWQLINGHGGRGDFVGWLHMAKRIQEEAQLLQSINADFVVLLPHYLCEKVMDIRESHLIYSNKNLHQTTVKRCINLLKNNEYSMHLLQEHISNNDASPPHFNTTNIDMAAMRACHMGIFNNTGVQYFKNLILKEIEKYPNIRIVDSWSMTKDFCHRPNKNGYTTDGQHYATPVQVAEWVKFIEAFGFSAPNSTSEYSKG